MICTFATVIGYGIADVASGELQAAINGFAAGALLVMLIDSMIPEAAVKPARWLVWSRSLASLSPPDCPT